MRHNPDARPLPSDLDDLMHLTIKIVDLLYWKPIWKKRKFLQKNPRRESRPNKGKTVESVSRMSEEREVMEGEELQVDASGKSSTSVSNSKHLM
jgi:hypothetical protein